MHRRVYFSRAFVLFSLCALTCSAQQSLLAPTDTPPTNSSGDKQSPSARQSAMNMVEEVLASTGSLELPQNRLAIEMHAFPTVWTRSAPRARALISQMAGEFAAASNAINQRLDENPSNARTKLREQRTTLARTIGKIDPELALFFLSATLPYVQSNLPNDDAEDHDLIVELAAQVALHDPRRALQLAEQELKDSADLPQSFIDLLEQVQRSDAQTGAHLFQDVVDHLKQQNLAEDSEELSFAVSLLANQFDHQSESGHAPDSALRSLGEMVAAAILASNFSNDQPFQLSQALPALDALAPAKSAAFHSQVQQSTRMLTPEVKFWRDFNQARSSGNADQMLAMLPRASEDDRPQVAQQIAWNFAAIGDLQKAQQVAANLDPWERNNVMQYALANAAKAAGSRSDFAGARQLAAQITDDDSRATLLCALAIDAHGAAKPKLAEEMLGEAASLVMNRAAGASAFAAQLRVAQAYLRVNPAEAVPLLERSASQLQQALSAAAQLDGFLPDRHSFEGSELILNEGFLYQSLIVPYAQATADLAAINLPAARSLADRLPLPEARLMTELFVANGVLDQQDQTQTTTSNRPPTFEGRFLGDVR
jgi:hypothetical protein